MVRCMRAGQEGVKVRVEDVADQVSCDEESQAG